MTLIVAATKRAESHAINARVAPGPVGTQHVMDDAEAAALCGATGLYAFADRPYSPALVGTNWCEECREKADALYGT